MTDLERLVATWAVHDDWSLRMNEAWRGGKYPTALSGYPETLALEAELRRTCAEYDISANVLVDGVAARRRAGQSLPAAILATLEAA